VPDANVLALLWQFLWAKRFMKLKLTLALNVLVIIPSHNVLRFVQKIVASSLNKQMNFISFIVFIAVPNVAFSFFII